MEKKTKERRGRTEWKKEPRKGRKGKKWRQEERKMKTDRGEGRTNR